LNPVISDERMQELKAKFEKHSQTNEGREHISFLGREMCERLFLPGEWLSQELEALGCSHELSERIGFANGQKCFMAKDTWAVAAQSLEDYKNGTWDEPGPELAGEICRDKLGM